MAKWENLETGIYYNRRSADQAVGRLCDLGFTLNDINVLIDDKTRANEFSDAAGQKAAEGAVAGAVIGGGISAIIASVAATGSIAAITVTGGLATPLVAGPLAAALAALGAGGAGGGIIGALIGAGATEAQAKKYEEALKNGAVVIGVHPRTNEERDRVRTILSEEKKQDAVPPDYAGVGGGEVRRY